MADDKIKFLLELDSENAQAAIDKFAKSVSNVGQDNAIEQLGSMLQGIAADLAPLAIAASAFVAALDLTEEAEQLDRINEQFKLLTAQEGLSASALIRGLEESSHGLMTQSQLLQEANKFIVEMGHSAERLPEIMELARKATIVFGGDFKTNFENMAQAIAMGNVRLLKHYGIMVDINKAEQEYAKHLGVSVNVLSEEGRRHAILNAALAEGEKRFKSVSGDISTTTDNITKFKVAIQDLGEMFAKIWGRTVGPLVHNVMSDMVALTQKVTTSFKSVFGDEADKAQAKIEKVQHRIEDLKHSIEQIEKHQGLLPKILPDSWNAKTVDGLKQKLKEAEAELERLNKEIDKTNNNPIKAKRGPASTPGEGDVDKKKAEELELEHEKRMGQIDAERRKEEEEAVQSHEQMDKLIKEEDEAREEEHQQRIDEIKKKYGSDSAKANEEIEAENQRRDQERLNQEKRDNETRKKMLDDYQKNSTNAAQGIGRAWDAEAHKADMDLKDFGKLGQTVFTAFQSRAVNAFEAIGAGSQTAGQAMKAMMLGALGDIAEAEGSLLLTAGIGEMNPVKASAGAGLLVLAGYLKAQAAKAGGMSGISGGMGGGGGYEGGSAAVSGPQSTATSGMEAQANPQKTVQVNIAGNLFETEQTRRQLMEMIRSETDATDFRYNRIGGPS